MNQKNISINIYCLILGAGDGTRMKSDTPKVMHPIAHLPMINHVIHTAEALNPQDIAIVIGKNQEQIKDAVVPYQTAIQSPPQGTADAVKYGFQALEEKHNDLNGYIMVLYGDTPLIRAEKLAEMIALMTQSEEKPSIIVMGMTPEDPAQYGRLVTNGQGHIQKIVEFKEATEQEKQIGLCNSGIMLFKADKLKTYLDRIDNKNQKGEYYLTDAIELAVKDGDICLYVEGEEEDALGVNSRLELADAELIFQDRMRTKFLQEGITMQDPASVFFAYDTQIGQDSLIEPFVVFGKAVLLGKHCKILAHSHLEGVTAEDHCSIGPFARLRPGTKMSKKVKIGNFVETKKVNLGEGSKVSHLTYIGDAKIGKEVNIGAGTITCNYDGTHKYETVIGDGAFIGSNSSLVAPAHIGKNAVIAAGSVITDKVEDYALALARSRQMNKPDWKKTK